MAKKKVKKEDYPIITSRELLQKPIGQISEEAYTYYGSYVNNFRAIANVADGCKVSYKRLIFTATQFPKGKDIPTMDLIAGLSRTHPHGTAGCEGLNAHLVKSGVFSGHGFFGNIQIDGVVNDHAATRYTKNRLSDLYWDIIGDVIKEVPYIESPQGAMEPLYIPLALPLCLYLSNLVEGLGVAVKTKYPNFSPKSLYQAYINNNPYLLEPNVNLILDKEHSELERLWKTGKGTVTYAYKISRQMSPDGKAEGILFEGDTGIFTPNLKKLRVLEDAGKVFIDDMTDLSGPKLFVGRIPGARGITIEEIETLCRKACYDSTVYQLNVTDGTTAFRIPLYDWIDYTYKNYINLVTEINQKRIDKVKFDIAVQEALPIVSNYIININPKASDQDIITALSIPAEIVSSVMSKPISYLRKNKDTAERVKELKEKLKELKKFNPITYTEQIINLM